ncbi:MAG: serine hydrolase domain-containing protein, partial [Acidobacteriota bacterium]
MMNHETRTRLSGLCLIFLFAQTSLGQSSKARDIDFYLNPFAEANQFSGVVLAAENGKVIYEKAFGLANADFRILNQVNTRIGIASITKYMTVVILARLIDSGKVSLSDKLNKYIPDFPNGDKITIEMLADHRSGIPHRVMKPEEETIPYTSAEFIEKVKQAKLAFEPGSQRLYSSAGFSVLARALEIASGKSYSQLLQEYVFAPADMKDSLDFNGEVIIERRAQDYLLSPAGYINASLKDYSFLVGAGSVYSTARDVYKFGEAVLDGKYGETVKPFLIGKTALSGNGSTNGHRAFLKIEREKKWGYVLVSNLNSGANDMILQSLEAILQGKEVAKPVIPNPKIIPNPNKNLSEFTGRFQREGGGG